VLTTPGAFYVLLVAGKRKGTMFARTEDVFPDCGVLIKDAPKLERFQCLIDSCHVGANCMERLARRVGPLFEAFPSADLLYLHHPRRDDELRRRAVLFWRDFREPRVTTINKWAWERMKTYGRVYAYSPPSGYYGIAA
jgi:hypothetical protein